MLCAAVKGANQARRSTRTQLTVSRQASARIGVARGRLTIAAALSSKPFCGRADHGIGEHNHARSKAKRALQLIIVSCLQILK